MGDRERYTWILWQGMIVKYFGALWGSIFRIEKIISTCVICALWVTWAKITLYTPALKLAVLFAKISFPHFPNNFAIL
jgi:hypothetical protein